MSRSGRAKKKTVATTTDTLDTTPTADITLDNIDATAPIADTAPIAASAPTHTPAPAPTPTAKVPVKKLTRAGNIGVKDWSVTPLTIDVPGKYKHLVPRMVSDRCEFVLFNCNNAIANAIRRTISCELPVRALYCEYNDIETDDPHIIPEMIIKRLRMIPVDQSIPLDSVFSIHGEAAHIVIDVKTSELISGKNSVSKNSSKNSSGKNSSSKNSAQRGTFKYGNSHTLLSLQPERSVTIKNIRVGVETGVKDGFGMHAVAFNATSIALDVEQMNPYENTGESSHNSDPRVWKISFNTNGTIVPEDLIRKTCDNITERLNAINLEEITEHDSQYALSLYGESHTIANLIMRGTIDLYPDIPAITYHIDSVDRVANIKIKYSDDINVLLKTVIDDIIYKLAIIKKSV
tara:strand:+ start:4680 stop:5894 length:1215 start_codon:yes stop_codon:yes gene_type:complete